jgi:phage shock protein PspC (stress-responsive transcriptional regulator)
VLSGVCGGIAEYAGIDASVIRIIAVFLMLTGQGLVIYAAAWLLLPVGDNGPSALDRFRERRRNRRAPPRRWEAPGTAAA